MGTLLGLAAGDSVGTALEFRRPGSFTPIEDLVGGGPFHLRPGEWTDDTSMALCLAESILDTGTMDLTDQLRRYLLWRDNGYLSSNGRCFDIGGTVGSQLERYRRTGEAVDPHPKDEAAANGSLMRLAPVPIRWHADPALAAARSADSSRSTHPARRPVDASRVLGWIIASLIHGVSFDEATASSPWSGENLHPAVAEVASGSWKRKEPPAIRGTGYCVDAIEAALWAVAGAADFRSAVLRAANLGDDADTTAAIAGQIAGARWGASSIPQSWAAKLVAADRITSLASELYGAGEGGSQAPWAHDDTLHGFWVEPGRLLAGEYPGHRDTQRCRHKINLLVDAGIRTFIDLTTQADKLEPYAAVLKDVAVTRNLDLNRIEFPIPDLGVVDDSEYGKVAAEIDQALEHGGVYVHCWGGVGRSGTVIGCHLTKQGFLYDEVIAQLTALRQGTRKASRKIPETLAQHDVIRRFALRN